ncbi:MAG: hypothetical protein HY551_02690, partial [Elusimicrobia bacterium]|nr:hypothetical protein [Elusimicrobiota bacterium]
MKLESQGSVHANHPYNRGDRNVGAGKLYFSADSGNTQSPSIPSAGAGAPGNEIKNRPSPGGIRKLAFKILGAVFLGPIRIVLPISKITHVSPKWVSAGLALAGSAAVASALLLHLPLPITLYSLWTTLAFAIHAQGWVVTEEERKTSQRLSSVADKHRAELLAIPGVIAVEPRTQQAGPIVEHYIIVKVTHLDSENTARIPKFLDGFQVYTHIVEPVREPQNANSKPLPSDAGSADLHILTLIAIGIALGAAVIGYPGLLASADFKTLVALSAAYAAAFAFVRRSFDTQHQDLWVKDGGKIVKPSAFFATLAAAAGIAAISQAYGLAAITVMASLLGYTVFG